MRSFLSPSLSWRRVLTDLIPVQLLFAATVEQKHLIPSRVLSPHARYYVREMRIRAYSQLLESYRSLTLDSMCRAFGVGPEFMDK